LRVAFTILEGKGTKRNWLSINSCTDPGYGFTEKDAYAEKGKILGGSPKKGESKKDSAGSGGGTTDLWQGKGDMKYESGEEKGPYLRGGKKPCRH